MIQDDSLLAEMRRLHEDRQTGILALANSKGERVDVFFREGMIEAAKSSLGELRLGDYLVKEGFVAAGDLHAAEIEAQRHKISFGEAIVRKNLAEVSRVGVAVRAQALALLDHAVRNGFSVDSFTSCLRTYYAPARLSFPQLLLELTRGNPALYEPDPQVRLQLCPGVDLSAFPWYPEERFVLNELRHPKTFQGLIAATGLKGASLGRVLGVLERLEVIEAASPSEEASPSAEVMRVASPPEFPFELLIPNITNATLDERLEVARNESSFTSEQFKNLKVLISEADSANPFKVFTVSSPDAQDGKSFVTTNLALSFAMDHGRRVIIVDCDLRNPALGRYLGVSSEPGLLQYLSNNRPDPYSYVRRMENLYFLTAGGTAPNPIEILSMKKMRGLIDILKKDFDTVILDAPPYSPIADARIVTGLSDGLILVVRHGKTSYSSADRTFKAIDRSKLLGVVFNDVKPLPFHSTHGYDYYKYGTGQQLTAGDGETHNRQKSYLES